MSRFCSSCGKELADDEVFCTKCGTKFEAGTPVPVPVEPAPVPVTTQPNVPENIQTAQQVFTQAGADVAKATQNVSQHIFTQVGKIIRWEKLAYVGMGMVAISVVLPIVSISFVGCLTSLVGISQLISFILLALCCIGGYYASEEKYSVPITFNLGIFVTFAVIFFKIHSALSEFNKNSKELANLFGKGDWAILSMVADKIVGMGMGVYFLLGGTLIAIIACAACRLAKSGQAVNIGSICNEAKNALTESVEIGGQKLPGFVLSIIVILILLLAVYNIEIFGFKVSALV